MKRIRSFRLCLVLALLPILLLSGCAGAEPTSATPSDNPSPPSAPTMSKGDPAPEADDAPSEEPQLPADDVTVPSIQSFANYKLEPEGDRDKDGYTILYYDLKRNDTFNQEYIDLLTGRYHFTLRSSSPHREGVDKYLDGAEVYFFDYTGTAPIVGFTDKSTDIEGVHDVDLAVIAKKTGFVVKFADGLVWTDTDERSTIFADPVIPPDADYIVPSVQSFANYQLKPEEVQDRDGYTIVYYGLERNDAFNQEYIDLLTGRYPFTLRSSGLYRKGVSPSLDGAPVYFFDYTGTAPIVGFSDNNTDLGEVRDIELRVVAKKSSVAISFADGLYWMDTDDRSTIFGGSEPQYPSGVGSSSGSDWDDDDDRRRSCAVCRGSGEVDCSSCGGSGEKDCVSCSGRGYTEEYVSTPNYSGSSSSSSRERVRCFACGGDGEDDCYSCRGHGTKDCTSCGGDGER